MINLTITKLENGKYTGSIGNTPLIWSQNDFVISGKDYAGTKMDFEYPIEVLDTILEKLEVPVDSLYEGWYETFIDDEGDEYYKLQLEYITEYAKEHLMPKGLNLTLEGV